MLKKIYPTRNYRTALLPRTVVSVIYIMLLSTAVIALSACDSSSSSTGSNTQAEGDSGSTTPDPDPVAADQPSTDTGDQGLTGLWKVKMTDPSLLPVFEGVMGLSNPENLIAPGGHWLIVEHAGMVKTSSCDTTAVISIGFDAVPIGEQMATDTIEINVPSDHQYDSVRNMLPIMKKSATMRALDNDNISFVVKVSKPMELYIPFRLTRVVGDTLSIAQAGERKGGTACSYAKGTGSSDFDLHLTTYDKENFVRLRFKAMSLIESFQTIVASLETNGLAGENVSSADVTFQDNAEPTIAFDFSLNEIFDGAVTISDFVVH